MKFGGSNFSDMPILVHFEDDGTAGTLLVVFNNRKRMSV